MKLADHLNTEDRDCSVCDRSSKANDSECKTVTFDGRTSLFLELNGETLSKMM